MGRVCINEDRGQCRARTPADWVWGCRVCMAVAVRMAMRMQTLDWAAGQGGNTKGRDESGQLNADNVVTRRQYTLRQHETCERAPLHYSCRSSCPRCIAGNEVSGHQLQQPPVPSGVREVPPPRPGVPPPPLGACGCFVIAFAMLCFIVCLKGLRDLTGGTFQRGVGGASL